MGGYVLKVPVQMLIGSTYKLTEMIVQFYLSLYIYKITEPKHVP